ncbi:hypothetical protein Tco_1386134 [Tanacetum coccineum]
MCFAPEDDNDEDRCFSSYGSFFFIFEEEVLCEISTSQSQENVHANQSSIYQGHLPVSPIPVEDSEPAQEEIDIFLVPDDLIPPGVENDDSEDEVNELPNLDHHIIRQFLVLSGTTGLDPTISEDSRVRVRIYQKSQENHQKQENTDTRTEERARAGSQSLRRELTRKLKIALDLLSEKAQGVTITDCHAGNPCVHICDPTAKSNDPIIEGIQGM